MKKIAVLGATGSIGTQALEVIENHSELFEVVCISANNNYVKACGIAERFRPSFIVMGNDSAAGKVRDCIDYPACVYSGFSSNIAEVLKESGADYVLIATAGLQGIFAFEYCLENNISTGLANKETIVCGGNIISKMMQKSSARVYPVDSEHSAIYQCLGNSFDSSEIDKILLTASGGPFFGKSMNELKNIRPEDALNHPNWSMGRKITVDSATLANKGQEVIEACFLFGMNPDQIQVVIHPESMVHSMVEYTDGSIMAQIGPVDMRLPIQRAVLENYVSDRILWNKVDLFDVGSLRFYRPDTETFRCLKLAYDALDAGGCATAVYSIADEIAVERFLDGQISFNDISSFIEKTLDKYSSERCGSVLEITELDRKIRQEI